MTVFESKSANELAKAVEFMIYVSRFQGLSFQSMPQITLMVNLDLY